MATTHADWCRELAEALEALLGDTSEGRALKTLLAYRAWQGEAMGGER